MSSVAEFLKCPAGGIMHGTAQQKKHFDKRESKLRATTDEFKLKARKKQQYSTTEQLRQTS